MRMGWGAIRKITDIDAVRAAAAGYIARGYAVCALDALTKMPTYPEWPLAILRPEHFGPGDGIGILAGPLSGTDGHALVFVDLDSPEAVELADRHLPFTAMMEGRAGKPRSHRGYMVPLATIPADQASTAEMAASAAEARYGHPGPRIRRFAKVLDIIGTGGQIVCPPTLTSSGEVREWDGGAPGTPAVVEYPFLLRCVDDLLAACGYVPKVKAKAAAVKTGGGASVALGPPVVPVVPVGFVTTSLDHSLRQRVRLYLEAMPPAVSGEGGRCATFSAACRLVWGFALDADSALECLALYYNPRCAPPWTLEELRCKVDGAVAATDHRLPRGHLLRRGPSPRLAAAEPSIRTVPAKELALWLR